MQKWHNPSMTWILALLSTVYAASASVKESRSGIRYPVAVQTTLAAHTPSRTSIYIHAPEYDAAAYDDTLDDGSYYGTTETITVATTTITVPVVTSLVTAPGPVVLPPPAASTDVPVYTDVAPPSTFYITTIVTPTPSAQTSASQSVTTSTFYYPTTTTLWAPTTLTSYITTFVPVSNTLQTIIRPVYTVDYQTSTITISAPASATTVITGSQLMSTSIPSAHYKSLNLVFNDSDQEDFEITIHTSPLSDDEGDNGYDDDGSDDDDESGSDDGNNDESSTFYDFGSSVFPVVTEYVTLTASPSPFVPVTSYTSPEADSAQTLTVSVTPDFPLATAFVTVLATVTETASITVSAPANTTPAEELEQYYLDGYTQGYSDGYSSGGTAGYRQGAATADDVAFNYGYSEGFNDAIQNRPPAASSITGDPDSTIEATAEYSTFLATASQAPNRELPAQPFFEQPPGAIGKDSDLDQARSLGAEYSKEILPGFANQDDDSIDNSDDESTNFEYHNNDSVYEDDQAPDFNSPLASKRRHLLDAVRTFFDIDCGSEDDCDDNDDDEEDDEDDDEGCDNDDEETDDDAGNLSGPYSGWSSDPSDRTRASPAAPSLGGATQVPAAPIVPGDEDNVFGAVPVSGSDIGATDAGGLTVHPGQDNVLTQAAQL